MAKKILLLNGSPRKNGNTSLLNAAFIEGAESAGNEVTSFDICSMNIHPCIGCLQGDKKDLQSPCVQKDDMEKIYAAFLDCDIIVFASPMYYWSFTAQLKAVLDRLFAITEANNMQTPKKDCIMLVVAGDDSEANYSPMRDYYHTILNWLNWNDLGCVFAGGAYQIGEIKDNPALLEARKLGEAIK